MSRVHRKGLTADVRRTKRRRPKGCETPPAAPTGVVVRFGRREVRDREEWRAAVRWDAVTTDGAGRAVAVEAYRVQLRATDASGVPAELDDGDPAVWRQRVSPGEDDEGRLRAVFSPLARPKRWYYQARVSAGRRMRSGRLCWGPWSPWTTPVQPASGALPGPPAPTGQTLTPVRDESRLGSPWVLRQAWNEVPTWDPPDGDPVEGAARYAVRLQVRRASDGVVVNTRRAVVEARDADADTTAECVWTHVSRKYEYRSDVRAIDLYGRRGEWAGWTPWVRPAAGGALVQSLSWTHPKPRVYVARWDPPADADGVIGYRVRVYRGATLVEVATVTGRRFVYHVPKADRGQTHSVRVRPIYEGSEEEGPEAASPDVLESQTYDGAVLEQGAVTPDKLSVSQLSAISVDAGRLTAGTIEGLTFRTGTSGNRIAIKDADAGDRVVFASNAGNPALVAGGGDITLEGGRLVFGVGRLVPAGYIELGNLGGDPPAPPAGVRIYAKGGRLYYRSANGSVYGPL